MNLDRNKTKPIIAVMTPATHTFEHEAEEYQVFEEVWFTSLRGAHSLTQWASLNPPEGLDMFSRIDAKAEEQHSAWLRPKGRENNSGWAR